ncbi:MAG TPA: Xaa-Pro peptidase family protein [Acidimicrobiales bacterium]|nr:Xaa-Pro peptidase family protein [Acidimicrobiales bacterium]
MRDAIAHAGCDALLVTRLVNIRWLTGFTGSAALLLVMPEDLIFVSDGRYGEQARDQLSAAGVVATIEIELSMAAQRDVLRAHARSIQRLALEADGVTWAQQRAFAAEWFPDAELVPTEGLIDRERQVKDDGEIARITLAAAIADESLAAILPMLRLRPTEQAFALELDTEIRRRGAEGTSFETIVGSGPNGAKPHARPGSRVIGEGDLVVIDFGAKVDGYCSDMTRTFSIGEPSSTHARMLAVVGEAQRAGVAAVRAGVAVSAVDAAARDVIAAAGWGDAFTHPTGHALGLEIHEHPRVASTVDHTLVVGNVVTVEPGVYLPDHGGVRIEDTVLVTSDGCQPLTHAPKLTVI